MLNELHDLAKSLKAAQVSVASWHNYFVSCPKTLVTYYLLLDSSGQVTQLEPIRDRERIVSIRKWDIPGQGTSFPGFNVLPLFEPSSESEKNRAAELRKTIVSKSPPGRDEIKNAIESLCAHSNSLWVNREPGRITKCLTLIPNELAKMLGTPPKEYRAIADLIARINKMTVDSLHAQLVAIAVEKIIETPFDGAGWFDLLFFHSGKTPKKVSLIAEVADRSAYIQAGSVPANHPRVQAWMNARFQLDKEESRTEGDEAIIAEDAFGLPATGLDETFPSVRFQSAIGDVKLRAMSSEHSCQSRYGIADAASCRVGQVSRGEMKSSLEWIGHPDRRGKTWCDVSSLAGKKGVLFAYPSEKPETVPEVAGLIVGFDDDADPDGAKFEAYASRVTASLTELGHEAPTAEVCVFVLTKPDGFRTKVLHSGRYSIERLLGHAQEWKLGCRNLPVIKVRQFGAAKGDKPFWADPFTPFPADVVSCLNTAWQRAGTHAEQVLGFGIGDGLGLLLEHGPVLQDIATRAVRTLVANSLPLVLALGWAHAQGLVHDAKSARKLIQKQAKVLPGIFGLLLAKLGRWKGDYMKSPPFLVGRLLSLADQLHVQYCHGVRNGQVPPQLAGNALVTTAMDSPVRAVSLIWQRIKPYHAWAQTVQGDNEVRLAKWLLGELGRVSNAMSDVVLPTYCSDTDKAEMLLGYLARSEKDSDSSPSTSNSERVSA